MTKANVHIPGDDEQLPIYANGVSVAMLAGNIFLTFGYVDPSVLSEEGDENSGEIDVAATPLVKIVMSPFTARQVLQGLKQAVDDLKNFEDRNEYKAEQ